MSLSSSRGTLPRVVSQVAIAVSWNNRLVWWALLGDMSAAANFLSSLVLIAVHEGHAEVTVALISGWERTEWVASWNLLA